MELNIVFYCMFAMTNALGISLFAKDFHYKDLYKWSPFGIHKKYKVPYVVAFAISFVFFIIMPIYYILWAIYWMFYRKKRK